MSQHDRRETDQETPSGQFSGDDIEFAPFMFDPASQPVDVPTNRIGVGETDMEFEPFMFNQGEALGVPNPSPAGAATAHSPAQSGAVASIRPIQPLPDASTASPVSPLGFSPAPELSAAEADPEAPALTPVPAPSPFAGQEVPMPSYLMPLAGAEHLPDGGREPVELQGSRSEPPADAASASEAAAPLPDWLSGNAPSTGPVSQEAAPVSTPDTSTGPVSTGSIDMMGPMEAMATSAPTSAPTSPTSPTSAPAPAQAAASVPVPSGFGGMTGRSRGNTGPLSAGLATGSWSDSSLASIEDFSSVLIALHAGKRLRQSGPLNGAMLAQSAAPATSTDSMVSGTQAPAVPASESDIAQPSGPEQPTIPEWAAQSMAGGATAPAAGSQWEPQLPPHAGSAWPGMVQAQTAMPEGEPLPPWSMNPPAEPPEATSWTAAQAEPAAAATTDHRPSTTDHRPLVSAATPTPELDAIRQVPLDQPSQTLESGVSDLLKTVDPAISDRSVSGDDLQFESFMFNEGVSAPLPVLPSIDPAALANLPRDAGPAFDPTQYANPPQVEETVEYGDVDPAAFGVPSTGASQGAGNQGPLPFWLQDKPGHPLGAGADAADGQAAPQAHQSAQLPDGGSSAAANDEDLGELPPIAPFDFATLGAEVDDEPFGFNTEELTGLVPGERDPMVVTANLEALADLMGGHIGLRSATADDRRQIPETTLGGRRPAAVNSTVGASTDAPTAHISPEEAAAAGRDEADSGSWIAAATANLPADSTPAPASDVEAGAPTPDASADMAADLAPEMAVEDLGVSPFDYSQLDLDEGGEAPTNYLQTGGMPQGPSTEMLEPASQEETADGAGAAPGEFWSDADGDASLFMPAVTETTAEAAETAETAETAEAAQALPGNPPEQVSPESSAETLSSPSPQTDSGQLDEMTPQASDIANEHSHSAGSASDQVITEPEQTIFRARVARGPWSNHSMEYLPDGGHEPPAAQQEPIEQQVSRTALPEPEQKPEPGPEPGPGPGPGSGPEPQMKSEPAVQHETADPFKHLRKAARTAVLEPIEPEPPQRPSEAPATPPKGAEGVQGSSSKVDFEADAARNMPSLGNIMTSGPLPSLAGFEDLAAWIERYPNDMGAHLALASAYTQAGDIDTALRVYRRVLRKQYVSENILAMIQDELQDLQGEAQKHPRYHQVRGDLLVRLGQRRAAIDEYNKLG